jgi:hypothetical protein
MKKIVRESLNELKRRKDSKGYHYGSKRSHFDKRGFRKHDSELSGKESFKGKVEHLLNHDYVEHSLKDNVTEKDKIILEYIERIASWLDIEL